MVINELPNQWSSGVNDNVFPSTDNVIGNESAVAEKDRSLSISLKWDSNCTMAVESSIMLTFSNISAPNTGSFTFVTLREKSVNTVSSPSVANTEITPLPNQFESGSNVKNESARENEKCSSVSTTPKVRAPSASKK